MVQGKNALIGGRDDPSSIPGVHTVEREKNFYNLSQVYQAISVSVYGHANKYINEIKKLKFNMKKWPHALNHLTSPNMELLILESP